MRADLLARASDWEELLASEDWTDNEWAVSTKADRERVLRVMIAKLRALTGAPEWAVDKVHFAKPDDIAGWSDRISDAKTLEELFA